MKHTPTPWEVRNGNDIFTELGATNSEGKKCNDNDAWQIANCGAGITFIGGIEDCLSVAERDANAEFIIRAVNSHEELIDLLKDAIPQLKKLSSENAARVAYQAQKLIDEIEKAEGTHD